MQQVSEASGKHIQYSYKPFTHTVHKMQLHTKNPLIIQQYYS